MRKVSLEINGSRYEAEVEPRLLLADLLRDRFRLTGTHIGCEHGVCGTCTVQIDGKPARSCLTLAVQADGCRIRTVEGLAGTDGQRPHPLQSAFHSYHALQCGYCTPGFLMSMESFLPDAARLSDEELRELLAGNLCRCTGYQNIVEATKAAATELGSRARGLERVVAQCELSVTIDAERFFGVITDSRELLVRAGAQDVVATSRGESYGRAIVDGVQFDGTLELVDLDEDGRAANFEIDARESGTPGQVRGALQLSLRGSLLILGLDLQFVGTSAVPTSGTVHALCEAAIHAWMRSLELETQRSTLLELDRSQSPAASTAASRLPRVAVICAAAAAWWAVRSVRRRMG
jgi:carbon-monoxide dehydrogenase small subunit